LAEQPMTLLRHVRLRGTRQSPQTRTLTK
jgi:hypothetical protein